MRVGLQRCLAPHTELRRTHPEEVLHARDVVVGELDAARIIKGCHDVSGRIGMGEAQHVTDLVERHRQQAEVMLVPIEDIAQAVRLLADGKLPSLGGVKADRARTRHLRKTCARGGRHGQVSKQVSKKASE